MTQPSKDSYNTIMWAIALSILLTAALMLSGCATFGIGENTSPEQAALEMASAFMLLEYADLRDDGLSPLDMARALVAVGDEEVQSRGFESFIGLVDSLGVKKLIEAGKVPPTVSTIYELTIGALEKVLEPLEPDPALVGE